MIKIERREVKKEKIIFKNNEILANKKVIIGITVLVFTSLFLIFNYMLNIIKQILEYLNKYNKNKLQRSLEKVDSNIDLGLINFVKFNKEDIVIYALIVIFIAVLMTVIMIKLRLNFKNYNINQKGSSRFAGIEEIKEQYKEVEEKDIFFKGKGGVPIARDKDKIYIDTDPVNNLIIGTTRSGKGELFVVPAIDIYSRAEEKSSMIITDPKCELYKRGYKTLKERGYEVKLLDLSEPLRSMGFNPLSEIINAYKEGDEQTAELLCKSFSYSIFAKEEVGKDKFWENTSVALTSALILSHIEDCLKLDEIENKKREELFKLKQEAYKNLKEEEKREVFKEYNEKVKKAKDKFDILELRCIPDSVKYIKTRNNEKKIHMYSIIKTFMELNTKIADENTRKKFLDVYFESRGEFNKAKMKYNTIKSAGSQTRSSIVTNTLAELEIFTMETIGKMTAESTLNLADIGFSDKPYAVFLNIPDEDKSNHFLASVFIKQLYYTLVKNCRKTSDGKCKREVVFLLDEFGNLPVIEGMDTIITVCLGRNIKFNLIVQSYAQLEKYKNGGKDTIIGNCANQIYILTVDKNTAKDFSELLGSKTITNVSRSGQRFSLNKSFTESYDERSLMLPAELMVVKEGTTIVKRVIKRRNLDGEFIEPNPIINEGKNRMKFSYEYLMGTFKSLNDIKEDEFCFEERKTNLRKNCFNYDEFVNEIIEEDEIENVYLEKVEESGILEDEQYILLEDIKRHEIVLELLKKYSDCEDMDISEAMEKLWFLYKRKYIKEEEYIKMIKIIELGKNELLYKRRS